MFYNKQKTYYINFQFTILSHSMRAQKIVCVCGVCVCVVCVCGVCVCGVCVCVVCVCGVCVCVCVCVWCVCASVADLPTVNKVTHH